jgi:hypothetical protein
VPHPGGLNGFAMSRRVVSVLLLRGMAGW